MATQPSTATSSPTTAKHTPISLDEPITLSERINALSSAISSSNNNPNNSTSVSSAPASPNPMELAKQTKTIVTELMTPRDRPFSETELTSITQLVTFLWEGSSRNFRLMAVALLCSSSAAYNNIPGAPKTLATSGFSTKSLFYRFFATGEGISLWTRAFDVCTCELSAFQIDIFGDPGTEMNSLLLIVERIIAAVRADAQKTPQQRMLEAVEEEEGLVNNNNNNNTNSNDAMANNSSNNNLSDSQHVLSSILPQELLCVPILHRLRDFAVGKAFIIARKSQSHGYVDEMRRTSINIIREACVWAPHRNLESCGILQALIDLYLVQENNTYICHDHLAETLTKCCFVGKLSPQDTAALFFPYVDVSPPTDHSAEVATATRRGKCELVLRLLASSLEGVAVFNCTAPLGLRLLIDALGLAGGSTKRKMLLMHIIVVILHAAAPHRDVQINGRWSSYAALDSTITKQFFGSRSFVVNSKENKNEEEKAKEEEQEEFDVIEDDDDDIAQKALKAEGFETNVPVSVEADPTTYFVRDATLGALLLILEREGLSRALISVLLPTVEELDPPLAEGSIALIGTLLNLMGNLLSFDVMIAINQALDNAIAHLLKKRNPIIGALIAKALPRPTTVLSMGNTSNNNNSNNNNNNNSQQQQGSSSSASNQNNINNNNALNNNMVANKLNAPGGAQYIGNNNPHANNANNNSSGSSHLIAGAESTAQTNIAHSSLSEKIEQTRILKSAKPLTEWNVFLILDIVQSPSLMSAVVAKEKIPVRFVKHLLHFFRCDGLGDAKYFGEPFRSIPRENTVPVLGQISVALIDALVQQPDSTSLVDHEIAKTLADFFVGSLMNPSSMDELTKFMSGDYLKWIRSFTSTQYGLKLLAASDFFKRIQSAATMNKAPEVWEMLVKSFSGKPGQNPDALGRCFLPAADPRPQFYVDVLKTTLAFDPKKTPSPLLIVSNGKLRTAALSQLFVLAARARFTCKDVLFSAIQIVFEVMIMSTVIGGGSSSSSSSSSSALRRGGNSSQQQSSNNANLQPERHDQALLNDCDLASQLLSVWIRMGGIDSNEWFAFESAAEGHLDKHVEKDYVQSVLHTCYSQPGATEGDTPIGICLRKCTQKFIQYLSGSPERLSNHVFGPLRKSFEESHFFNRNDPPIPGSRRYGSFRSQLLGAIAESEHGFNLLKESSLFASLVHAVNQVGRLVPVDGGSAPAELMSRLQRDSTSLLSWAPASSYAWDSSNDPAATEYHHQALKNSNLPLLNDIGTGNSINRHQNIHVALLALGSICSTESGAQLVGLDVMSSIVSIAAATLSNVASLSNFISTSMITLSLMSQSVEAQRLLNNTMGYIRCEPYDPSASSKNLGNAKVAFFSPASITQIQAHKDIISSCFQVGANRPTSRVSPVQKNPSVSMSFPMFQTESFHKAGAANNNNLFNNSNNNTNSSGSFPSRRSPFSSNHQSGKFSNGATIPHELFMVSNSEAVQKEPFKSVLTNLNSANNLKNALEKLYKKNSAVFFDLENKRLIRLMMAQPIALQPEARHLISLFFYMNKTRVKKFVESS